MGSSKRTILQYLPLPLFGFGVALMAVSIGRMWHDPHARSMALSQLGVTGLIAIGVIRALWYVRKQHNLMRDEFSERSALLDRKLTAYETVANELNVVIESLPAELPEAAQRAVWNIREELRMSLEGDGATVRRPLP